jgi:hypothetical protein
MSQKASCFDNGFSAWWNNSLYISAFPFHHICLNLKSNINEGMQIHWTENRALDEPFYQALYTLNLSRNFRSSLLRGKNHLLLSLRPSFFFEAEGFGLPCTAWAGLGLLVKSRLIGIRADEGARERTRSFEIELVLDAAGRDIQIKCADGHAIVYYVMRKQARWGNADARSYLVT